MAITESRKQSDLEKRLRLLRQQVYGRETVSSKVATSQDQYQTRLSAELPNTELAYFYQDLLKIGILASLAIGVQIILFILTKNHILNLNFF